MGHMTVDQEYRWSVVKVIAAVIVLIAAGLFYIDSCNDCEAKGGVLVQTAFGYSCVEKK